MTATPKLQPNHALDLFEKYLAAHNKSPNTICVYPMRWNSSTIFIRSSPRATCSFTRSISWSIISPRP